ncbi:MAG: hypothetical protein K2N56_11290 [Oscillospiraceae bacterium]|nr:hypothetical protein [Oscillospiraceae bacterium]
MLKKIGSIGLIIGSLLALTGVVGVFLEIPDTTFRTSGRLMAMACLARAGAIVLFAAAIVCVAGVFLTHLKKGGAITGMVFALIAFVGQFFIEPITSPKALFSVPYSEIKTAGFFAFLGLMQIALGGVVLFFMGIVGVVSKKKVDSDSSVKSESYI